MEHYTPPVELLSGYYVEYDYNNLGEKTGVRITHGTNTDYDVSYEYYANGWLKKVISVARDAVGNPKSMTDWTGTWEYGYDWVGNRLHPPADPDPMVYNEADQLLMWPGMYRYSYDGAGNLTQVKDPAETQTLASYTYTPAGLLDTATYKDKSGNTQTLVNTWDADSNRVKWLLYGTVYQTLVHDVTAGIPAVLNESFEDYRIYYIREPGGSLIARYEAGSGFRYYHFDELGSTRLLTNEDGAVRPLHLRCLWLASLPRPLPRLRLPALPVCRPARLLHPLGAPRLRPAPVGREVL